MLFMGVTEKMSPLSYFEYLKIPYTHSGVISSFNAMNKLTSKRMFIKNKIKTPKYFSLKKLI